MNEEKTKILCLPFAGGNKHSYKLYQKLSPGNLDFITLEYAGHGQRLSEALMESVDEIALDIYHQVRPLIEHCQYAIYGHSMGAIVGFELIHKILAEAIRPPSHFFVTGRAGPSCIKSSERHWHQLSKPEFFKKLEELDGFPPEVLTNSDLMDFL